MDINDPENTLILELTHGPVVIELNTEAAPNHCARIKELQVEVRRRNALLREVDAGEVDAGGGVGGARGGGLDAQREEEEGAGQRAQKYLILRAGCGLLRRASAHLRRPGTAPGHKMPLRGGLLFVS